MNTIPYKTYLEENELPECWYNMRADMKKKPAPLLNPATGAPCTAEDLSHVFCDELVAQELDETTRFSRYRSRFVTSTGCSVPRRS